MPLLDIWPDGFVGNRDKRQRRRGISQQGRSYVLVSGNVRNRCSLRKRIVLLQSTGVGFPLICVLKEDSVTAAQGPLSVAFGVPCEAEARRRVEQVSLHATRLHSRSDAALYPSVVRVSDNQVVRIRETRARHVMARVKVSGIVMNLAVCAEQTHAQAQVKSEATGSVPIVL